MPHRTPELIPALKFLETSLLTTARPPKFSYPQFEGFGLTAKNEK